MAVFRLDRSALQLRRRAGRPTIPALPPALGGAGQLALTPEELSAQVETGARREAPAASGTVTVPPPDLAQWLLSFIAAMGYDVFNPTEVVPEFTADVGVKKGEKVDYAIKKDGDVVMLFECKPADKTLDANHASQLFRYFTVTNVRIAVLTNGLEYRFYSDLEEANKMDARPFLVLDPMRLKDEALVEAQRLTKEHFTLNEMLSAAGELKYLREIRLLLETQFTTPDDDFVRFFHSRVSSGRFTQNAKDQFAEYVKRALALAVKDRVSGRLRSALEVETVQAEELPSTPSEGTQSAEVDDDAPTASRRPKRNSKASASYGLSCATSCLPTASNTATRNHISPS